MVLFITPSKTSWLEPTLRNKQNINDYPITGVAQGKAFIVEDFSLTNPTKNGVECCLHILEKGILEASEFRTFMKIPFRTLTPDFQFHRWEVCTETTQPYGVRCISDCGNYIFILTCGYFVSF